MKLKWLRMNMSRENGFIMKLQYIIATLKLHWNF